MKELRSLEVLRFSLPDIRVKYGKSIYGIERVKGNGIFAVTQLQFSSYIIYITATKYSFIYDQH